MHPIVTALERHCLLEPNEIVERFLNCPYAELCRIWEQLHHSLHEARAITAKKDAESEALSSLNLLAGSSMRGAYCVECAVSKLVELARYAALYSDRVLVPFELQQPATDSSEARYVFSMRVISLTLLRPVIEADVLRPVVPEFHFCSECGVRARAILRDIETAIDEISDKRAKEFQLIYRLLTPDRPFLEICGPEDYFDHGTGLLLSEVPSWAPKRLIEVNGKPGKVLSISSVKRNRLLRRFVFRSFREDAIFQQLYGYRYGTKYLTDRTGEAELFRHVSSAAALYRNTEALCARLQHSVPLFRDLPLATVLRLRREDPGSFIQYRQALGNILQNYLNGRQEVSDEDAISVYRDVLNPELLRLQREEAAQTGAQRVKVAAKTVLPAAVITLGVFSGFLPHHLAELAKIVGATSLLNQAGEALLNHSRPSEIRNHNLYFLLRLSKEAKVASSEAV